MNKRKWLFLIAVGVLVFAWIVTLKVGREAVSRYVFETEIYKPIFCDDRSRYTPEVKVVYIVRNNNLRPVDEQAPRYYIYTRSYFPMVVAHYFVEFPITNPRTLSYERSFVGERVYLWLLSFAVPFSGRGTHER